MVDESVGTTPLGMIRYAGEFFEAAILVNKEFGGKSGYEIIPSIPALYLVGHSIELSLKAYLMVGGISLRDLRNSKKYGHSLHSCFRKAKELGLLMHVQFSVQEEGAFELLDSLYVSKQLEYIVAGKKYFPIYSIVETFAKKVLGAVSDIVESDRLHRAH